jgi:hypothetical protein
MAAALENLENLKTCDGGLENWELEGWRAGKPENLGWRARGLEG